MLSGGRSYFTRLTISLFNCLLCWSSSAEQIFRNKFAVFFPTDQPGRAAALRRVEEH
jgi:hypothetical protein